jgi:hypothetical protein
LSGFAVVVTCAPIPYTESSAQTGTVTVYTLTSTATQGGVPGSPDYVERTIQVSIAR